MTTAAPAGARRGISRRLIVLIVIVDLLIAIAVGLFAWVYAVNTTFEPIEKAAVDDWSAEPGRTAGAAADGLRVLTYNIHYGAGGRLDHTIPTRAEQDAVFEKLVTAVQAVNPHIVALQEVDRRSARSFDRDQYAELAKRLGMPYGAFVTTWRHPYIPFPYWPPSAHFGAMWSGQAGLSRFPLKDGLRVALPQPPEKPWWFNRFYLHRALQVVTASVPGVGDVQVLHAHTEAFYTGNRNEHGRIIKRYGLDAAAAPWIFLGDLNATPPEAALRKGFPDEPDQDQTADLTISLYRSAAGAAEAFPDVDGPQRWTFPSVKPNRTLDHVFFSGTRFAVAEARVVTEAGDASDHLPVFVRLRPVPVVVPAPPAAGEVPAAP